MRMDAELSRGEKAVRTYRDVTGSSDLDTTWDAVRNQCYEASAHYLSLTAEHAPALTQPDVDYGVRLLQSAIDNMSAFQTRYSEQLNSARGAIAVIDTAVQQAQQVAQKSRALLSGLDARLQSYRSVRSALWRLDDACARLSSASDYAGMTDAAKQIVDAAAHLDTAVHAAPGLKDEAAHALSSISARINAAETRLEGVQPALSALLKEFAAASSADLVSNENTARARINQANEWLTRARNEHDPEEVLSLVTQIRAALREADQLIDAVPNRLRMLHELRDEPEKCSARVRFELRDAQMLAVNRGLTREWASQLDAQLRRIELLEQGLNTPHPDYWSYSNGLDKVDDFIQSVVQKIRASR